MPDAAEVPEEYLLVKLKPGLNPRLVNWTMHAMALFGTVACVFNAEITGLPLDRLRVITGEPTPATVQKQVRRKVTLGG